MTASRARATRSLRLNVIERLDDAEALSGEWDELCARVDAGPFSTPSFALAWWRHVGRGDLLLVTVRNGQGELVGIAPFHERRIGRFRVVRFLGHGLGTVGSLISAESKADIEGAIWSWLADDRRLLDLTEFRHGGVGLASLRHSDDWHLHLELRDECPTVELAGYESATDFLRDPARRNLRKKLGKIDRTLESAGRSLVIDTVTDPDALPEMTREIDPVFEAAERAHPRLHLLEPPYRPFLVDAMRSAAEAGNLAVLVARLDDTPIAFDLHVRNGTVARAWLGRFDPAAAEWSPGHLLLRAGLDWAIGAGVETLDLQLGSDLYKRRWATSSYDTVRVVGATHGSRLASGRTMLGFAQTAHGVRQQLGRNPKRNGQPPLPSPESSRTEAAAGFSDRSARNRPKFASVSSDGPPGRSRSE